MNDSPRPGRPEASATVWEWRSRADQRRARAAAARRDALFRALVAAIAGGALFFFERPIIASVAWSIGALTLTLGLASPLRAYAGLEKAVAALGRAIGTLLLWLLFTPVFFLFVAPFGLLFKRGARDPLKRRADPDAKSHWRARRSRPLDRPY